MSENNQLPQHCHHKASHLSLLICDYQNNECLAQNDARQSTPRERVLHYVAPMLLLPFTHLCYLLTGITCNAPTFIVHTFILTIIFRQ